MGTRYNDTLTGSAASDSLDGAGGNDLLQGLAGEDVLNGGAGDDTLDGGLGADVMSGGAGNDTFIVDDMDDEVLESAGRGLDTIQASVSYDLRLSRNVENLTLTGTAALDAQGNGLDNRLVGNAGDNRLNGGGGQDTLEGGNGSDTYVFRGRFGADLVHDHDTTATTPPPSSFPSVPSFTLGEPLYIDVGNKLVTTGPALSNFTFSQGAYDVLLNSSIVTSTTSATGVGPVAGSDSGANFSAYDAFSFSGLTTESLFGLTPVFDSTLIGSSFSFTNIHPLDLVSPDAWDEQPNTDSLRFEDASYDRLWFKRIGQDLEVSVVGATDKVTVRDWFADQADKVELTYDAGNAHVLRHDKVQGLVDAMAGFSPQALSGQASLIAARDTAWTTV